VIAATVSLRGETTNLLRAIRSALMIQLSSMELSLRCPPRGLARGFAAW
jgi:hypothetical protein